MADGTLPYNIKSVERKVVVSIIGQAKYHCILCFSFEKKNALEFDEN